jgi:hypothetical protein
VYQTASAVLMRWCCCYCPYVPLLLQADWFKQHQQSATEQVKGQLWSHWLPKCVDVFRRLPPVPINGDTEAYFRSAVQLPLHR